eukprot:1321406-Amorphochlora_amoeboformis.AAC.1
MMSRGCPSLHISIPISGILDIPQIPKCIEALPPEMAGTEANGGLPQAIFRTIGLVSIAMMVLEYKLDVFGFGKGRDLGEVSPGIVERRHVGIEDVASADLKRALGAVNASCMH